ncbi:phospholipid-transporting ATPase, putative [Entamoeba dispar SAW760]|uniref:Phospholipid-transporting ATPase, putative n=1 Tax=Entamoeba dispar (strain ATCC PRA-260 / SAW760) TaxID=370354 RepID=B0EFJ3_ENTDS|nr:phospholipid-transporting ATPase, putative [Entamoeba dispar SAW760]EDR26703.1 phospholipid-transporting ATPase, putative [Entamoeba dispar SAW760]|eukprot:EDR26703.1 phospholipid-transporting ATPase, putative [Entamoeba dispar SAW760]
MINAASVGVGIYGKEGSQAARSADYSIYRFKHLGKLILYHGRMSLYRNTSLIKLIFFKNAAFFLHLLWFACICMFTSQRLYDDYMMALYNFIFTSIPPVFISFFDSDLSWKEIKENPQVNRELIRTKRGNLLSYIGWFIYGTYQSMVYFYLMIIFTSNDVMTLNGKTSGMVGASAIVTTYTTLGVIATFATTVKRWNGLIIFGFCVSIGSFFFTYFFLASFNGATRENMSYFSLWRALQMPYFYLYSLLAIILAITPNILKSFLSRYINPQNYELIQVFSKTKDDKLKKETKEQGSGYTVFHDK